MIWTNEHGSVIWNSLILFALCVCLLVNCSFAGAQQGRVPRIGVLEPANAKDIADRLAGFKQGLRDLGYIEGKTIAIEYRYANGEPERIPGLAAELVKLKPDVMVTSQTPSVFAIKQASSTIPIVFFLLSFPIENGIIASYAQPGGNATGFTVLSEELNGKRLELLKETAPSVKRVGVLSNPSNPTQPLEWKGIEAAAVTLGLALQPLDVRSAAEFDRVFEAALKNGVQALINLPEVVFTMNRKRLTEFATQNKLPAMCSEVPAVIDGCLMSYSPNQVDLYRRSATYVDKILKGAKPADLPVERPTKFDFVINLDTAKKIGLIVPQKVLLKADRVIK